MKYLIVKTNHGKLWIPESKIFLIMENYDGKGSFCVKVEGAGDYLVFKEDWDQRETQSLEPSE